jgi:hypothetical protein
VTSLFRNFIRCLKIQFCGHVVTALLITTVVFFAQVSEARLLAQRSQPRANRLPSFQRILSFDELMRLSKPKRAVYIQGLRKLFKDLEATTKSQKAASQNVIEQRRSIASLLRIYDLLLSEAGAETQAAEAAAPGTPVRINDELKCVGDYRVVKVYGYTGDNRASNYVCVTNRVTTKTVTDLYSRGCPGDMKETSRDAKGPMCSKKVSSMTPQTSPCGKNTVPINQDPTGAYLCATDASFRKLPLQGQRNARVSKYFPMFSRPSVLGGVFGKGLLQYFRETGPSLAALDAKLEALNPKPKQVQIEVVGPSVAPVSAKPMAAKPAAATKAADVASAKPSADSIPVKRRQPPAAKTVTTPRETSAAAAQAPSTRSTANPAPSAAGPGPAAVGPVASSRIVVAPTDASDAPAAELAECAPNADVPATCDADSIEAARTRYASDSSPDCIYAGQVVGYEGGQKRSYKCEAPHSFCFGASNCRSDSGEAMTPAFTCGTTSVICNPLLFGVKADGKTPFCVERSGNATSSCDSLASSEEGAVQPLDQQHAGIREAWNDFADKLSRLCQTNEISKTLHCEECHLIRNRLFALNVAARDVRTCGAAIKFEDSQCSSDGSCTGRPGKTPAKPQPAGAVSQINGEPSRAAEALEAPDVHTAPEARIPASNSAPKP